MVLVAVGQQQAHDAVLHAPQVAEVRDDQVYARMFGHIGETQSAIDDQGLAAVLHQGEVLADFTETAERGHRQEGRGGGQFGFRWAFPADALAHQLTRFDFHGASKQGQN